MAHRGRGTVRRAPARRKRVWARLPFQGGEATGTTANQDMLSQFIATLGAQPVGTTVARIRGVVSATLTGAEDRGGLVISARVTSGAPAAGADAIAGPLSDLHADWMLWEPIALTAQKTGVHRVVDVRAMRKLEELEETLVLCIQATSGNTIDIQHQWSVLLLLP